MPFPDELMVATPTPVAEEILLLLSDEPVSDLLRQWLGDLRGEYRNAQAQDALWER